MPQIVTEGRVITDEKHLELLNEMLNAKERKEKAKEEREKWEKKNKYRKKSTQKSHSKKSQPSNKKKLSQKKQKKTVSQNEMVSQKKTFVKQDQPQIQSKRAAGQKFCQNLKEMMFRDEDSDRSSSTSSSDEVFEERCTVCDLKYPPSHSSEQCCSKEIDSWVHCDSYDDWFLKVRFPFDVDIEKDFICDGCI